MSETLKPGLYHIRSVNRNHLPPGPGGRFATSNGEGSPVTVEPIKSPVSNMQTFNVIADPEADTNYQILLWNSPTFAVPGWSYVVNGVGEPVTIAAPSSFRLEPVEGVEGEGIYHIGTMSTWWDSKINVGVHKDNNNLTLHSFRLGIGLDPKIMPIWQFVPVNHTQ